MDPFGDDMSERQKARQESYKAGISATDARRQREKTTISIRKKKKNEKLRKRRQAGLAGEEAVVAEEAGFTTDPSGEQRIDN